LSHHYSVQDIADKTRGTVPELTEKYEGLARIETYTIIYRRDGEPQHGVVVLRCDDGRRTMAMVDAADTQSMGVLTSLETNAIGAKGFVRIVVFAKPIWEVGEKRDRKNRELKFTKVTHEGRITIIHINRPEAMNALHPPANAELAELFDDFAANPEQCVAIITGEGDKAFSSGNDLKYTAIAMARGQSIDVPTSGYGGLTSRFNLNKPIIAAVNGIAMGGGFEIALACDLIIASQNAIFALPEPRVGLAALAGGLLRLPRQIGLKKAMGIILTGRRVSAQEGVELGFVNEVTTSANLMETAKKWANKIIECSPMSIQASKQIVHKGLEENSIADAYVNQNRYDAMRALYKSSDIREGPLAFAQKRKPNWS
jgi:acetyl-CoA C-acetyltransferase